MKRLTNISNLILTAGTAFVMVACGNDPQSPGYEYMPDMYRSPAVEPYVDYGQDGYTISDTLSVRKPVEGTIPRGFKPYPYPNTEEGYKMATENLKNPIALTEGVLAEGKDLYSKFCSHCHGTSGDGQGQMVQNDLFPSPGAYNTKYKDVTEGQMFHSITYGKGLMGSHASQLSQEERWKIVHYVQTLQK